MTERTIHQLDQAEINELRALRGYPSVAFGFWARLCAERGLDASTVITQAGYKFSALPAGHGQHWCWPFPLRCSKPPGAADGRY